MINSPSVKDSQNFVFIFSKRLNELNYYFRYCDLNILYELTNKYPLYLKNNTFAHNEDISLTVYKKQISNNMTEQIKIL